jgi:hypothetical protein
MEQRKTPLTAIVLMFTGGILILLNSLLFASGGGPIILSSGAVQPENVTGNFQEFWWRASFGIRDATSFATLMVLLTTAALILFSAILLLVKPRFSKALGILAFVCSVISVFSGGGFIIGAILAIGGSLISIEAPKKPEETFFGRLYRSARFDSSLYRSLANDAETSKYAVLVLLFVNLLSGLGIAIYAYNSSLVVNSLNNLPELILLFGGLRFDFAILMPPLTFMGISVIKWMILTGMIYLVALFVGLKPEGEKIARVAAFAYVPIALQFFIPFVFSSAAYLNVWPTLVFVITNIWMIIILIAGLKEVLEIGFSRAFGIVGTAGSAYFLLNYFMFIREGTAIRISPTINVLIYPEEYILLAVFVVVVIAALFGTFRKR